MNDFPNNFFLANVQEIYLAQFNEATRNKKPEEMEQELIQLNFPVEILEKMKQIGSCGFKKLAKKWNYGVIYQLISVANSRWEMVLKKTLNKQRCPKFYEDWIVNDLQLSEDAMLAKKIIDFLTEERQEKLCEELLIGAIYNMFTTQFLLNNISKEIWLNPEILISESIETLMTAIALTPWRKCYQIIESEQLKTAV